jgi:hypothetical protein
MAGGLFRPAPKNWDCPARLTAHVFRGHQASLAVLSFALRRRLNRDLPSEIRKVPARDLTEDRVRPNFVAISTVVALEMMSFRNSSSSSEVQAFALFTFLVAFVGIKERSRLANIGLAMANYHD